MKLLRIKSDGASTPECMYLHCQVLPYMFDQSDGVYETIYSENVINYIINPHGSVHVYSHPTMSSEPHRVYLTSMSGCTY
jgi:hypothetical protein